MRFFRCHPACLHKALGPRKPDIEKGIRPPENTAVRTGHTATQGTPNTPGCPHCAHAKALLEANGIVYEEVTLGKGVTFSTIRAVSGAGTAPQVFIGGRRIGGADELAKYLARDQKRAA